MHGNKRIRYQGKLIYSYEDGVPTVLCEINARSHASGPLDSSANLAHSLSKTVLSPLITHNALFLKLQSDLSLFSKSKLTCLHISTTRTAMLLAGSLQKPALMSGLG